METNYKLQSKVLNSELHLQLKEKLEESFSPTALDNIIIELYTIAKEYNELINYNRYKINKILSFESANSIVENNENDDLNDSVIIKLLKLIVQLNENKYDLQKNNEHLDKIV